MQDYEWLREFVESDSQAEVLDCLLVSRTVAAAANKRGITERNMYEVLRRLKQAAAKKGKAPEFGNDIPVAEGFNLERTTTLRGPDGEIKLRWERANAEKEARAQAMREFVEELSQDLKPRKKTKAPKVSESELMVGYPIGDHHWGMLAWPAETLGRKYDLDAAEEILRDAIDYLVEASPPAETALLANLGDFLHIDNRTNATPKNKNVLDVDSRYPKVARAASRGLAHACERLLEKHKKVRIINAPGNHDPDSAGWLSVVMDAYFRNEPRVEVDMSPATYLFHQFGLNMICVTHGDKIKLPDIPGVMAALQPEMWGATKYRVAWTGHLHHGQQLLMKENRGARAETFGVLPPNDEFGASHGYISEREMHAITFKKSGGVQSRVTFNAELR